MNWQSIHHQVSFPFTHDRGIHETAPPSMANSREGPNPLRPYYIPPSIGFPPEIQNAGSSGRGNAGNGTPSYASSARDIFGDIDYSDYVSESSQSTLDMIRQTLDEAMYKYLAVLLAQPFDVAKTILQVRTQTPGDGAIPTSAPQDGEKGVSEFMGSRYTDVCGPCLAQFVSHANDDDSILQTTQIQMNLHISQHLRRLPHHIPRQLTRGGMLRIALVTSYQLLPDHPVQTSSFSNAPIQSSKL